MVKKAVVDACFNTSLLYGCEAWLGIKPDRSLNGVMEEVDVLASDLCVRKEKVQLSSRTKLMTCRIMNPNLSAHPLYESTDSLGDDYLRITFSKFRLSSHKLKIETGRWTCIPQENRLCQCGETIQTERHVLCDCPLVNYIRLSYGYETVDLDEFINNASKQHLSMLKAILDFYQNL